MTHTVRWGILGTGSVAGLFASDLQHVHDAALVAVGSRDAARAMAFARRHGAARAYGSYDDVWSDDAVDVVYVATPNSTHRSLALAALAAGKAVLCEKPFTVTAQETRDIVALARQKGRFCMEAMWMRFAPAFRALQERLASGEIGEIRHVRASLGFPVAFDAAHRIFTPSLGGGALLDLGVYALSCCAALLGTPERIDAQVTIGASNVDEHVVVRFDYAGGAQATVETSVRARLSNDAVVSGTRGRLSLTGPLYFPTGVQLLPVEDKPAPRSSRVWSRAMAAITRTASGGAAVSAMPHVGNGYQYQAQEVVRCLQEGRTESAIMPLDESIRVMEMIDAVRATWTPMTGRSA